MRDILSSSCLAPWIEHQLNGDISEFWEWWSSNFEVNWGVHRLRQNRWMRWCLRQRDNCGPKKKSGILNMLLEACYIIMLRNQLKEGMANWTLSSFLCNLINVVLQRALCAKKHIAQLDDFANHYSSFPQLSMGNHWRYRSWARLGAKHI
jgi:hypothetical protein